MREAQRQTDNFIASLLMDEEQVARAEQRGEHLDASHLAQNILGVNLRKDKKRDANPLAALRGKVSGAGDKQTPTAGSKQD